MRESVMYAHHTMGHLSLVLCIGRVHAPRMHYSVSDVATLPTIQTSHTSVAPSHVGLRRVRRKPALATDGRGLAQHGHGVRTRTWKQWHRLLERLRNGATATSCATVRCFHYKRGPWPILRISHESALRGPRLTRSRSCTTSCTRMVSDHARAAPGHAWRYRLSGNKK